VTQASGDQPETRESTGRGRRFAIGRVVDDRRLGDARQDVGERRRRSSNARYVVGERQVVGERWVVDSRGVERQVIGERRVVDSRGVGEPQDLDRWS